MTWLRRVKDEAQKGQDAPRSQSRKIAIMKTSRAQAEDEEDADDSTYRAVCLVRAIAKMDDIRCDCWWLMELLLWLLDGWMRCWLMMRKKGWRRGEGVYFNLEGGDQPRQITVQARRFYWLMRIVIALSLVCAHHTTMNRQVSRREERYNRQMNN